MGEMPTQFPMPPISKRTGNNRSIGPVQEPASIFRACHERFTACLDYQGLRTGSPMNETVESYLLDFDLASKRALGAEGDKYRLFQLHFLEGRSPNEICEQLGMSRFTFASEISQIEKLAGQSFVARGLYPLTSYFHEDESPRQERRAA